MKNFILYLVFTTVGLNAQEVSMEFDEIEDFIANRITTYHPICQTENLDPLDKKFLKGKLEAYFEMWNWMHNFYD